MARGPKGFQEVSLIPVSADFEEHNAAGFYQVFVSLQNFHTFVKEYLEELQDMCASSTRMVTPIAAQFARE